MAERDEWIRTYRETIESLYAFVSRRVGGDRDLAEDLVQETYLRALESWSARGRPREPARWLTRVAANLVVDHWRKARPTPADPAAIEQALAAGTPADNGASAPLAAALALLPDGPRELLEAFHLEGRSVREIAAERRISERAVEGRLRRAREALGKTLRREPAKRGEKR